MFRTPMPWFVALPDTAEGSGVARTLRRIFAGAAEIGPASGRPWLIGEWLPGQLVSGRAADTAVAVCGEHAVTATTLAGHARRVRTAADLDALHPKIDGSTCLVASVDGVVRAQGTASGLRRVFHAVVDGVAVVSDRATVLAALTGAEPDPARLAARLLFPVPPWPLGWSSLWLDVHAVRPGHCVVLDRQGGTTGRRWWWPPEDGLSRAESVAALRSALTDAVAFRAPGGSRVVSHLSGLDSSSLCSLAVRNDADVLAITAAQPDAMDDDVRWAERTVAALRADGYRLRHEIISADECPLVYQDVLAAPEVYDDPFLSLHNRSRMRHIIDRGEAHEPRLHFAGLGGDELGTPMPTWLHSLVRQSPARGLHHLRAAAARNRWPLRRVLRQLWLGRTYPAWLHAIADGLDRSGSGTKEPLVGWDMRPTLPEWATPDALRMAAGEIRRAADIRSALAAERGMHHNLAMIHTGSQATRGFQLLAAERGITLSAPFFDDRVLDAVLSTRIADRYDPSRYKPVLVDAMRGIVPETTLRRTTKSETAASAVMGSRAHRDQLLGLAEDSRLARLGLIDPDRFRSVCRGPIDVVVEHRRIEPTLCCEVWLRTLKEATGVHLGS